MKAVYGEFLTVFPELLETVQVFTEEDKSDIRAIRAIYIPHGGDGIKRRKYTSGNTALDIVEDDNLYVPVKYVDKISIADYILLETVSYPMRVTKKMDYIRQAGYIVYKIERITGATSDQDAVLPIKEPTFA